MQGERNNALNSASLESGVISVSLIITPRSVVFDKPLLLTRPWRWLVLDDKQSLQNISATDRADPDGPIKFYSGPCRSDDRWIEWRHGEWR